MWVLVAAVYALQVTGKDVACPVGTGTARVFERIAADTSGGWDSDLATYSSGGQFRAYAVATCTDSLFSVYGSDIPLVIPPERRSAVDDAVRAAAAEVKDPKNPETWERYLVAGAVYAALGRPEVFLGDLYTQASWVARDEAVGFYAGLEGPIAARALIDGGWAELRKPLSLSDRKKVLYNLARVAHRGGWGAERDGFLAAFEAAGGLTPAEITAVARFRRIANVVEPALQDRAITRYLAALRGNLPGDEKIRVTYVTADLLRRRGRAAEAVTLFFLVANDTTAPDQLRALSLALAEPLADVLDPKPPKGSDPTH